MFKSSAQIIKKYKLNNKQWIPKSFHGVLHTFFPVGEEAIKPLFNYYGDTYQFTIYFVHNDTISWYWNKEDAVRLRNSFIKKVQKNPAVLTNLFQEWKKRTKQLDETIKLIDDSNLKALSNKDLNSLYKKMYAAYIQEYGIAVGIQDEFSMTSDEFLNPLFKDFISKKGNVNKFNLYFEILTSATTRSFLLQERIDLLTIRLAIDSIQKLTESQIKKIQKHTDNYHWIKNNYATDANLPLKYFLGELSSITRKNASLEINTINHRHAKIKRSKQALIKKLKLPKNLLSLITITDTFSMMQDTRKMYMMKVVHYQYIFLKELSRRTGLTLDECEFTVNPEYLSILTNKKPVTKKMLAERKKHSLVIHTKKGFKIFSGETAKNVFDEVFSLKNNATQQLRGAIANPGLAHGKVRIIRKVSDLSTMKKGEILVASMTRPEMVSAMKKAAGIIRDEGGITSHAAVVSRELKIPCIIGRKIATKIFANGDKVIVDANTGIIKKP